MPDGQLFSTVTFNEGGIRGNQSLSWKCNKKNKIKLRVVKYSVACGAVSLCTNRTPNSELDLYTQYKLVSGLFSGTHSHSHETSYTSPYHLNLQKMFSALIILHGKHCDKLDG